MYGNIETTKEMDIERKGGEDKAGLGIRLSVLRANRSFFVSERAKVRFALFLSESFRSLIVSLEKRATERRATAGKRGGNGKKHTKNAVGL